MKLGGWWRLWIAVAGIYAAVVVSLAVRDFPEISSIHHHPSFVSQLSKESQSVLTRPPQSPTIEMERKFAEALRSGETAKARLYELELKQLKSTRFWESDNLVLEMPNGHIFSVPAGAKDSELDRLGKEYTDALNSELGERRKSAAAEALLWWAVPTFSLCLLGLLFRWVKNGFLSGKA